MERLASTSYLVYAFGLTYPLLGGLFFNSGTFIQAILIPFSSLRSSFEYGADALTSRTFGSDGMPTLNYAGVLMHEVCRCYDHIDQASSGFRVVGVE